MANEWPIMSIDECASQEPYATQIGPFGKALMADAYTARGVPVLRGVNVNRGRFHDDDYVYIDEPTANRLSKFESFPDDVLLVHKGTLGQIGLMPKSRKHKRYIMGNSMMRVRCNPNLLLPDFLYYWLCSKDGQHYIFSRVSQVGVPQLQTPLTTLRKARLPVPPISEQKCIVQMLASLDDKIELNRKMNETLEAMARALFKSWFVDFDPVRAKAEGRDTGLPDHLAALFPDSFKDSEVGEIPAGWQVRSLGEVCENIFSGGTPSTTVQDYWGGGIPWLSSGETRERFVIATEKSITNRGVEESSTRLARAGATVIASAGQGNTRGQTSMLMFDSYINQSVVALLPDRRQLTDTWLFFDLERRYEEFRRVSDGHSSRGSLTTKLLAGLSVVAPPYEVVAAFDSAAEPIVRRIASALRESHSLAAMRDALLPKLISGEIRLGKEEERA